MAHVHDHTHGHTHTHDHGHAHAHGHGQHHHDHHHGSGEYYLEQLLTIGICGAFGVVAILMYLGDKLKLILVPEFHLWVLGGGIALLFMTMVRVIALWRATAPAEHHHNHTHDHHHHHEHGPECDHEHGPECQHDHHHHHEHVAADHSHDDHSHGGIFWRAVVLMFPLALFFMGLPNQGYSKDKQLRMLGQESGIGDLEAVEGKGGAILPLTFADLNAAALTPESREGYEGFTVRVKGQVRKLSDKECTLYYLKMTCCAADMIPLKARIITEDSLGAIPDTDWREVTGILQFAQIPGKDQYIPVIRAELKDIKPTKPE